MLTTAEQSNSSFINRFSTFKGLLRVTATCLRFANLCRKFRVDPSSPLTVEELECAKQCLIKMEQISGFRSEIESLQKNNTIAKNSKLKHLNPFLDQNGLLRVGGRLRHADLQCDAKHPVLLPPRSELTELIILHEHIRHCHAGADATLAAIRQSYWPLRARGTVKRLIHSCIKCFRFKPRSSEQIMGDLPSE